MILVRKPTPNEPVQLAVKRLAEFFRVLSNPRRIVIVEELRNGEKDVSSLATALNLEQSAISKHLAVLRTHRLVVERREGRSVFYRLSNPEIAAWIVDGLRFAGPNIDDTDSFLTAAKEARSAWHQNRDKEDGR